MSQHTREPNLWPSLVLWAPSRLNLNLNYFTTTLRHLNPKISLRASKSKGMRRKCSPSDGLYLRVPTTNNRAWSAQGRPQFRTANFDGKLRLAVRSLSAFRFVSCIFHSLFYLFHGQEVRQSTSQKFALDATWTRQKRQLERLILSFDQWFPTRIPPDRRHQVSNLYLQSKT